MPHDDLRVEWIRQRVSAGFVLAKCPECFDELLLREDGEEEKKIIRYLDETSVDDSPSCLMFFKSFREENIEIEVPLGKCYLVGFGFYFFIFYFFLLIVSSGNDPTKTTRSVSGRLAGVSPKVMLNKNHKTNVERTVHQDHAECSGN